MEIRIVNKETGEDKEFANKDIVQFFYKHLDEFGDTESAISKAIDYAFANNGKPGGFVVIGIEDGEIVGAVVMNKTGMEEYIPEYILVYIAVDRKMRGKGAGKQLMNAAAEHADGDIALHVEPNNPARHLYEKLGYTNKYLEMRLQNK